MKDESRWMELCQQASIEQDPESLVLINEINHLLDEKEERLRQGRAESEHK